ncbi:MAG: RsmD family RNA methyltransferase [Actinobacteria bacterium]|nr:RsmD family RNA methyltransferase [Actinomycetota bacterium]
MRVIGGSAKGTRLAPVPAGTRPVSDRAREGLFSSLGDHVEGARVLDLFAGTGALGIEALSRGAAHALFVDSAPAAARTIAENLRRTRLEALAEVRRLDVRGFLRQRPGSFDLVLADPPYRFEPRALDLVLAELGGGGVIGPGSRVILTRSSKSYSPVIPIDWVAERRLCYGDAVLIVFAI